MENVYALTGHVDLTLIELICSTRIVIFTLYSDKQSKLLNRRVGVEVERSPCMREIGVRSPVATDRPKSKKQVVIAPLPNARQQV